jgi:outer membrane protein
MRSLVVTKYTFACIVLAALAAGVVMTAQTPASLPAPTKVGILNLQAAITSTQEGQAAAAELQKRFIEPKSKELDKKRQDIQDMTDRLQRGGNTMSDTAKASLQHEIDVKTKSYQRDVEDYNADRDDEERKILDTLLPKMRALIAKYAQENGYRVILDLSNPNSPVMYWADEADLTQKVIEAYDKANPATVPAAGPGKASPPPAGKQAPPAQTRQPGAAAPGKQ